MAEAIIFPVATAILEKIAYFAGDCVLEHVSKEIKTFKSLKEDLKGIAVDLKSIASVLNDAEAKQYSNDSMKIWLRDLKSIVYDIDDLLDEVATEALYRRINNGGFLPQVKYYLSFKPLISRFHIYHKIKDIRLVIDDIVARKNNFHLTDCPVVAPRVERDVFDVCSYVNTLAIVGRDEAKNSIMSTILGLCDECSHIVLPVLGMGGIGKTALVKLVYNDIDRFDIKLWVCVSDKFDMHKVLEDILKDATGENTSNYSLGKVIERLRNVLNGKRYFLVLDDLWESDIKLWMELKNILAVGERGSTILITTRWEKVASITQTVDVYKLDELSHSFCWCIFKNLAFPGGEDERYPRLSEIGHSIVEKCCGNPLVIQSLGSLLHNERDEEEWLRVMNMDNFNRLDGEYETVKQLLKLSYDKLPSRLKPAFAHLSLFAKDHVYVIYYNIYFCSALGLLKLSDGSYFKNNVFNEMLSRSMLQDESWSFTKTIATFKIHDLFHDIAGNILGEDLAVVTRNKLSVPESSRYVAWGLTDLSDKEFPELVKANKARAFVFQFKMRSVSQSFLQGIISNMPCLRILAIGSSQFEELPHSIQSLKHLRFLDLSNNALIKSLPDTLCELLNLEFLLLDGCKQLEKLPLEIYKLVNLRFLSLTTCQKSLGGTMFNRLPSLRHLCFVGCKGLVSLWDSEDARGLTSLCSLEICGCPKLSSLPNSMNQLVGLKELMIIGSEELDLEREDGLSGLHSLQTLLIIGNSHFTCMPKGIHSAARSLKHLCISECEDLVELTNSLQSFAFLEKLVIWNCYNLLCLPEEIRHLKFLQCLKINGCPHISQRCATVNGVDLSVIRHVPELWLDGRRLTPNQQ